MSFVSLSLPLLASSLFLGVAWLVAGLVLPMWLLVIARFPKTARSTPLISVLPWMAGAVVALASLLPGDPHTGRILACHCLESMPSWLHLCPVHAHTAQPFAFPAVVVLALLLPARLHAMVGLVREPLGHGGGAQPRIVPVGAPLALLHGWLRPTLVIDHTLWLALSEPQRRVVLAHERGHLRRSDPLVRLILRVGLSVAPRKLAARVLWTWLDYAEQAADAEAARETGDAVLVAETLVHCARLGAKTPRLRLSWTGGAVEQRIHALLNGPPSNDAARSDVGPIELVAIFALGALALGATPWVHHQVEHILNLSL